MSTFKLVYKYTTMNKHAQFAIFTTYTKQTWYIPTKESDILKYLFTEIDN